MRELLLGSRPGLRRASAALALALALVWPDPASAQNFGKNKVQFERFQFQMLETQHFDIYFYPAEEASAKMAARMAERWYARLSRLLGHELRGRQPLILYASHPHFSQTNVIDSMIGEGTGGVTEGLLRRITLPLGATLAESDHVIGHELVHAFQYDMLGPGVGVVPLWFIEGMAEYLSIGPRHAQTAMWLRDAVLENRLPPIDDLDNPDYFPYRWGQALWAYIGGRWGDDAVASALRNVGAPAEGGGSAGPVEVIEQLTGMKENDLSAAWHAAIKEMAGLSRTQARTTEGPVVIGAGEKRGEMNISPALSPDGSKIAFLSERGQLSIDLYLADARDRRIIRKLISTAVDPHFQSLQFLMSAGSWHPAGRDLVVAAVRQAYPVLAIVDTDAGRITREIKFEELDEIFQPAWAPDGRRIAFSGQAGGFTDLYVHDVQTGRTERLTNDAFADLQPSWAPDGQSVVFVTDRFTTNTETLSYGRYALATVGTGTSPRALNLALTGNATNPHWLPDGSAVVFVSDATGRPEVYAFEPTSGRVSQVATVSTGISGITPLSPALSVASAAPKIAYSVFRNRGFDVHIAEWKALTQAASPSPSGGPDLAALPPASRPKSTVATMVGDPASGLVSQNTFTTKPYRARLSLVDVGQQLGVSTGSAFGSYVSGGIALTFSDILGNQMLGTSFGVNGGVRDITAQVIYADRGSRWNWGVFGDRVPYLSGSVASGFVNVNGSTVFAQEVDRIRQTYHQAGAFAAYPFSTATRFEISGSAQHIGFHRELQTLLVDPVSGALLSDTTTELPSPTSLRLFGTSAALVRDTSVFGVTGPLLGQRLRLDLMPTFGDLRLVNVSADYRQYFMPVRPVTFAGRLMHLGRYGTSGEDDRLTPLFLGYPDMVRGYGINSFDSSDCGPQEDGGCAAFDRLLGSRVLVGNFEVRAPLVGLFKGRLDYGAVPVDVFVFADAGVAWARGESPTFAGGSRQWVSSVGGGARVNLFGFAIGEFNLVRPLNRPQRGWMFVFNLRPGF